MCLGLVLEHLQSVLFQIFVEITLSSLLQCSIAQFVECWTEKPGTILNRVQFPGAARDFPPSQLSAQTLSQCSYGPSVQLCALTSVYIKNPKTLAATPITTVWTHENAAHADRNG